MSLASPYQEHYYVADGVTTSFSFGEYFTGLSQAYVKCIIYFDDGTNCVPTFTVDMTTGFITIVTLTKPDGTVLTVPPAGSIVRVFRDTPEQQNVTASQLQNYTAKQLERIFDSVVAMIQEVSYSDLHKTIRLTETQRDVSVEQLTEEKDQGMLYWDFESRTLKATDYGQDEVVKSETVDRLLYLQPEGKIYFIPKGSNNPIAIGSATIHNDLGGRNAPDCHPESAITGLTTHLQELRDADIALAENVQTALNRSQEAKDTAGQAKETAEHAQAVAEDAKDIAEDAKETAEGIEDIAQEAKDTADDAKDIAQDAVETVGTFDSRLTQAEQDASDAKIAAQGAVSAVGNKVDKTNVANKVYGTDTDGNQTTYDVGGFGQVDDVQVNNVSVVTNKVAKIDLTPYAKSADLATVATTGDYDDLSNKPTIPAAQVNSDWNANSGVAQILNKPTLATVATSGSYTDLSDKPTIPTVNNPTITITQGGVTKGSFALNQATGDTIALDAGGSGSYHPDLFDYKWADHICNDTSWLRADTFSWQSGAAYQAAYQHLADEYVESSDWATPSRQLSYSTFWESINYIGTQFVALEFDGYISTSTDGTTWTTPVQNAQLGRNYWTSFVYNGSIAVAIGGDGHISTSTDGTTWTTATQNAQLGAHNWEGITYGNGKFVTIGYNGYISTSTNGTTWTSATQNAQLGNQTWRAIAYGNGVFVVINDYGYISTSTDGTTWTTPVQNAQLGANYWNNIMFDGNQFFALGSAGYISTSVDGTTWTTAVQNTTLGNHTWATVATNGTRMVAVGAYGYVSTLELSQTDVVAGIAVTYCLAADGHKICPASEESNVLAIYNATGEAWYYIIDTTNQRFKLPRRHSQQIVRSVKNADGSWYRLYADGWVEQGGVSGGLNTVVTLPAEMADTNYTLVCSGVYEPRTNTNSANWSGTSGNRTSTTTITLGNSVGFDTMGWRVSGQSAIDMSSFQDGEKYLYFYVGTFTQTAIENTAGLNTELFNGKVDLNLNNVSSVGKDVAVGWNIPDYSAGIVVASDIADFTERTYTAPADGVIAVYLAGFNGQDAYIKINDVTVERVVGYGNAAWVDITGLYPVKKGSVIKFKDGYAQATLIGSKRVTFYPFTK